jgi:hypothetical protein
MDPVWRIAFATKHVATAANAIQVLLGVMRALPLGHPCNGSTGQSAELSVVAPEAAVPLVSMQKTKGLGISCGFMVRMAQATRTGRHNTDGSP